MYKFFVFKEFNCICDFFYQFLVQFCTPTSQTSGVSILYSTALYQTSDLLQCMAISNRCHMDGTFYFCRNMQLARQWNELHIFLTGDNIHTDTPTVICSSVLYKFLLLFCIRSAGNPEKLEVHLYVMFIWLINIVLWHVKCVNQICLHAHLTELFSQYVTVHWLWTYTEICPSFY